MALNFRPYSSFLFALLYLIVAVGVIGLTVSPISPGGPDDGLLHLAGATNLLQDGEYPIVQRPPLYSVVLAALGYASGIDIPPTQPLAQELGNIDHLEVASAMLDTSFLRHVLILNLVFWSLTTLLVIKVLRDLAVPGQGIVIAMLLILLPSSWESIRLVSETPFTMFLLASGVFGLSRSVTHYPSKLYWLMAGTMFALAALARAMFQLLSPLLLILLIVIFWRRFNPVRLFYHSLIFILPFIVIVGGWSAYNFTKHGFLGVSGVTGVALSTRTARIVDRAASAYPDEAVMFQRLRDETYLSESNKDNVVYWGARASNWLMTERDMSYLEANHLLTRYNLAAIRSSPLTYFDTVMSSLLDFYYPGVDDGWSPVPRLFWSSVELIVMGVFVGGIGLWIAAHILARLGFFATRWRHIDTVITLGLLVYVYTALITSAIDIGKPQHRFPVQFLIPLLIVLNLQIGGLRTKDGAIRMLLQ